jgi:hypothetical protein
MIFMRKFRGSLSSTPLRLWVYIPQRKEGEGDGDSIF